MSRFRSLLIIPATTLLIGCGQNSDSSAGAPGPPVVLEAEKARHEGAVQKKWDRWVVWCGHNICDGSYTWTFPASGTFEFVWKDVVHKCAGSSPYKLFVDGKQRLAGKIPQHGSCEGCTPQNIVHNPDEKYGTRHDIGLGRYRLGKGSEVRLWVQNSFLCGIENPGAYGGHFLEILASPVAQ